MTRLVASALCLSLAMQACAGANSSGTQEYDTAWKNFITGSGCKDEYVVTKSGDHGDFITCQIVNGVRHFKFPVGQFDIDEQVEVPANTAIEGNANPNDPSDKTRKPEPSSQTYFVATHGISDHNANYCGTHNNLRQGDAQKIRIGFLLNSNTQMKNFNFQGRDTIRPYDNDNLCGGGVFETPGCVSPGFGDGTGGSWVTRRNGCYDHTGQANNLITGNGRGVENVIVDSVRLNDLYLPTDPNQYAQGQGSQLAVWVAMTQDGSATRNVQARNVVSMLTRGDGINYHGNVQDSVIEDCHVENTGDDGYALWGAYAENPTRNVFSNNVAKNVGVTRNYGYGVCVAVYGANDLTISGTQCYDRRNWNSGCKNGLNCNSCVVYVHDWWFGAVYPGGNSIKLQDNKYFYMDNPNEEIRDRPLFRKNGDAAHVISDQGVRAVVV